MKDLAKKQLFKLWDNLDRYHLSSTKYVGYKTVTFTEYVDLITEYLGVEDINAYWNIEIDDLLRTFPGPEDLPKFRINIEPIDFHNEKSYYDSDIMLHGTLRFPLVVSYAGSGEYECPGRVRQEDEDEIECFWDLLIRPKVMAVFAHMNTKYGIGYRSIQGKNLDFNY